jgi:predicted nuclease of predicted toxin-antitoxin system
MSGILIDENLETALAGELRGQGYVAVHVQNALEKGASDDEIARHARKQQCIILTNDRDFLDDERFPDVQVFMLPDNTVSVYRIAREVDALRSAVNTVADLQRVTWLSID